MKSAPGAVIAAAAAAAAASAAASSEEEKAVDEKTSLPPGTALALADSLRGGSWAQDTQLAPLDARADRRLTAKVDLEVIPVMGLLYLICFLDRTNIANARLAGLETDLAMPSRGYNTALWIFYIPFVRHLRHINPGRVPESQN